MMYIVMCSVILWYCVQVFFVGYVGYDWVYVKLLVLGYEPSSVNSRIWPFGSQVLNLIQSIHKKVKTCNGEKVDIQQT